LLFFFGRKYVFKKKAVSPRSHPASSNECFHRLVEPSHPRSPNAQWSNCTYMSACAHPVASVLANVYADGRNTRLTYTRAHAWCSQHLSKCMHTLCKKCICARACAHIQRCRSFVVMKLLQTYLESCASIVQAAVAARPTAVPTKPVARSCSLKKSRGRQNPR